MLHKTTGFCPYGSGASDETYINKDVAKNAKVPKSPIIESQATKYNKFGTGQPKRKWLRSHKDLLKID
ncbi:MAG: hypothetical protein WA152_01590 [Microgenomates group bacterium]